MSDSRRAVSASASFGLLLIGVAIVALIASKDIQQAGIGAKGGDPGPRAFPIAVSILLLVGGTVEVGRWFWQWRRSRLPYKTIHSDTPIDETLNAAATETATSERGLLNVVLLIIAMAIYLPAISFLGFSISTFAFSTGAMIKLGTRWWLAAATTIGLLILIRVLFVFVFGVQLPEGVLDDLLSS